MVLSEVNIAFAGFFKKPRIKRGFSLGSDSHNHKQNKE
jgi:hypothetical protein